ncbi:MAG: UMP kinase [bacterium]|nr:UMP kinase [bacterium]
MKIRTIISLGGSLIVPEAVDSAFLKKFRALILSYLKRRQFFIIAGGGHTTRHYQEHGRRVRALSTDELHWIGIHATRLNAHLLRIIFGDKAHREVLHHGEYEKSATAPIIIGGGGKPGGTTDHMAVKFAHAYGAKEVLNLSNIDTLYDRDPQKYKNAKPIHRISWEEFRKMFPAKTVPGFHGPFDPVAAKLAQELKLRVVLLGGRNLKNIKNYFDGKSFKGTVIE